MAYNVDFLLSALVFLLIILNHFMQQRALNTKSTKAFLIFLLLGIANIIFDLLCTLLITLARPDLAWMTECCLTILYLLQILVPVSLLSYIRTYCESNQPRSRWKSSFRVVPPLLMGVFILFNHWGGLFFRIDSSGSYVRGPYYLCMYLFAGAYILMIAVSSHIYAAQLGRQKVCAIREILVLVSICVAIQSIYHDVLLTGFGIAMCIAILFFTINNPYQHMDSLTGLFDLNYFREQCNHFILRKKSFHVLSVDLCQLKRINRILGTDTGNQALIQTAQMLRLAGKNIQVFRSSGKRFLLICPTISEYEAAQQKIQEMFSHPMEINGNSIASPVAICGIIHAEHLDSCEFLLGYLDYLSSLIASTNRTVLIQGNQETRRGFRYTQEIEHFLQTALEEDLCGCVDCLERLCDKVCTGNRKHGCGHREHLLSASPCGILSVESAFPDKFFLCDLEGLGHCISLDCGDLKFPSLDRPWLVDGFTEKPLFSGREVHCIFIKEILSFDEPGVEGYAVVDSVGVKTLDGFARDRHRLKL